MARRTVHVPDELDERVAEHGEFGESYSSLVQQALREYLDEHEPQEIEA